MSVFNVRRRISYKKLYHLYHIEKNRSRPAIPTETTDNTLDKDVLPDAPKEKIHYEMIPVRKASLDKARERAREARDQLKISNEKLKSIEEPQSAKPVVETPIPLVEFDTKININIETPKKSYVKKGEPFYILDIEIS